MELAAWRSMVGVGLSHLGEDAQLEVDWRGGIWYEVAGVRDPRGIIFDAEGHGEACGVLSAYGKLFH